MNDVIHTVTDGLWGTGSTSGTGIHIKIGASTATSTEPIVITGNKRVEYIREKLGLSPLTDSVMDAIENGANKIICLPVMPGIDGTITEGESIKSGGAGSALLTGKPNNRFSVKVLITGKGGLNMGAFRYSINGGYTYADELSLPLSGRFEIPGTGLTVEFSLTENQEFAVNDMFVWETTEPKLTNENVIAACEKIRDIKQEAEFVHIVGSCSQDTWAAVSMIQKSLLENAHKPLFFMLEAFEKKQSETMPEYIAALKEARKKVSNYAIQVVAARGIYTGMDNLTREINFAGIVSGLYAKVAVHKSIGETAVISLSEGKVQKLLPEGVNDDFINALDEIGYLTIRQYDGLSGYYINNARMMGAERTDYKYAEDVRVINKIIRETRKEALLQLQSDVDLDSPKADIQAKAQFIQAPLDAMIKNKEISAAEIIIPEDVAENILTTESLALQIRYVQRGIIRNILIDIGKRNPYAG